MRLPLVFSITWRMFRRVAAASIGMIWGWMVGSPPENWTTSGLPSVATRWSRISSTSSSVRLKPAPASAEQSGQSMLQAELTSMIPRQTCCWWSGQRRARDETGRAAGQRLVEGVGRGQLEREAVAGVHVDGPAQLRERDLVVHRQRDLVDQLAGGRADDRRPEDRAVPAQDELHQAALLAGRLRAVVARDREAAHLVPLAALARLPLGQADLGDLRVSEDRPRDRGEQGPGRAGEEHVPHRHDRLPAGVVGELER